MPKGTWKYPGVRPAEGRNPTGMHTRQLLRIMGKLVAAGGRLTSSGPESGIVDGESPSISLSYIDKTDYKRTHTCAYCISTESVCHQLGSCLVARYLSSTTTSSHLRIRRRGRIAAAMELYLSRAVWMAAERTCNAFAICFRSL